jgi:hypothetical protein
MENDTGPGIVILRCPNRLTSLIITFIMKFPIFPIYFLDHLPWHLDAPTDSARAAPRENANPTVSLDDPRRESSANLHGSVDSVASSSSTVSSKSDESFATAFKDAQYHILSLH